MLERATSQDVSYYLQEKLWRPLGMEFDGSWCMDSEESGFELMQAGINASAIDFAKFGRLYLENGSWDDKQVVPAAWVAQSTEGIDLSTGRPTIPKAIFSRIMDISSWPWQRSSRP